MVDSESDEPFALVPLIVESDDFSDIPSIENVDVLFRRESNSLARFPVGDRTHESNEFARDDPVEVTLVHAFVLLVFLDIEGAEVVPAMLQSELQSAKTVQDRALVVTGSFACISVGSEYFVEGSELVVSCLCIHFEHYHHESAHQERCISLLIFVY